MTKSTIPNEWLQPLVNEKVAELNREATKDFVTVEKKVFDSLQKNNLDLMERLNETNTKLTKARLAIAQIYEIIGEISGDDIKEIENIIKEYGV